MKNSLIKHVAVAGLAGVMGMGTVVTNLATFGNTDTPKTVQAAYTEQQFLDLVWPSAQQVATSQGLYASVMIAQAMLESNYGNSKLAQAPNYNLFGIKGDYNGAYVAYETQEWRDDHYETVVQNFKKYPDYYSSIQDNGDKLRNGVSWQPLRYNGAWIENTNSYEDATAWLTGRYATAPDYNTKLNNLIARYNLTKYDPQISGTTGVVTSTGTSTYNMYAGPKTSNGDWLGNGTQWRYDRVVTLYNGEVWYRLGGNQWASGANLSTGNTTSDGNSGVVKMTSTAHLYSSAGTGWTSRTLAKGTDWRYFETKDVNGTTWYNLGGNQWISGNAVAIQ
ncbi:glucosaminidase domain-containing protein [Agrilactobacillus yilanensis]|uniref:Glucosaminidase domain-containing protein n=1 Tax=Agrilactobacillus yilanensis TaxID=2485997 RepID=A0ABW4J625_9LACO|nr:glycoside hydrolase family 73 protein [Agrilactobacillus yilanensis]